MYCTTKCKTNAVGLAGAEDKTDSASARTRYNMNKGIMLPGRGMLVNLNTCIKTILMRSQKQLDEVHERLHAISGSVAS